jgi:hypothetical protein
MAKGWVSPRYRVAHAFKVNGDEECLLACDGTVRVIGAAEKKKHEREVANSRCSITLFKCGSAAGHQGPTFFIMAGKEKAEGYTDKYLKDHGAAPHSSVEMTPTAFMTDAAWEAIAEKMAKGIRAMPIIEDHPDWWVRYSVDGFGSHKKLLIVMRIFAAYLITLLIEEADSSHVNQPFDRGVAKHGKSTMRGVLDLLLQNPMTLKTKTI